MTVTAPVPGASPVPPAIPVASLLAPAGQPGILAGLATAGGPADLVSLSPAALLQQASAAPGLAMRQLGSLLQEFEQIARFTSSAAPRAMGELAAEIGAVAGALGAGVQALRTLAHAPRQAGRESADPAPASAAPAPPALPASGGPPDALPGTLPLPDHGVSFTGPAKGGAPLAATAEPDHAAPSPGPGREAQAVAVMMLRGAADTLALMQLRLDAAPAAADRQAAAAPAPEFGTAWCEAQIALAQAQVARASRVVEDLPPAAPGWRRIAARLGQRRAGPGRAPGRHRRLARTGALLTLLGVATAALWMASRLDLTLARIAAATLLALAGLTWTWRRSASWRRPRIRLEVRR